MEGKLLPNVEFPNGKKFGSSDAILRMLGAKFGYYPDDPQKAYQCDFLIEMYLDIFEDLSKPYVSQN